MLVKVANVKNKLLWPLARILKVSTGEDNQVRVAEARGKGPRQTTKGKQLQRPIHHLYPLELNDYDARPSRTNSRAAVIAALMLLVTGAFAEGESDRVTPTKI